jgi:peptide chain release factor subunit 1
MGLRDDVTEETLRRLARTRVEGARVLSVYLNLDPERFATARARSSEVTSLIDDARRQVDSGERGHDERVQLRADVERAAGFLRGGGFADGAHGLAIFSCASIELFETLALPHPVENAVVIDDAPFIAPLAEIGPPGRWCVALVNRRLTRVLRGSAQNLNEVVSFGDPVHGQHSQGGWSQARYQRSVQHDVDEHLRRTAQVLLIQHRRRPFQGLLLAAPQELRTRLATVLHPYVRELLAGYLELDVENTSLDEARAAVAEAVAESEAARKQRQLERLHAALGSGDRASAGPDDVFRSLHERRVEALLYRLGVKLRDGSCPLDGTRLQKRDDLLEAAVEEALSQAADVVPVDGPELGPVGDIAALLRF